MLRYLRLSCNPAVP